MLYPNNIKKQSQNFIPHANRGMDLENMINDTNQHYLDENIALIHKKPTPIGVDKVGYEYNKKVINKAFFKTQSTLDYNGLYKGKYIDFEAKETTNKTAFPLANIHKHQINHIRKVIDHGGICFLLIKMNGIVYLLMGDDFISFIDNNTRKSITYTYIEEKAHKVKIGFRPRCDYLKIVDKIYFMEGE